MQTSLFPMRIPSVFLVAAGLLAFVACGKKDVPRASESAAAPPPPAVVSWPATRASGGGSFEITLEPEGGAIGRNRHFALDVMVEAKAGEVAGLAVAVAVDADMPAHQHGMNTKPEVVAIGDGGRYRVEGMLFHMAGDWVIKVDVTRGEKTESATFPVSVE